jgi:hypothetical protein
MQFRILERVVAEGASQPAQKLHGGASCFCFQVVSSLAGVAITFERNWRTFPVMDMGVEGGILVNAGACKCQRLIDSEPAVCIRLRRASGLVANRAFI